MSAEDLIADMDSLVVHWRGKSELYEKALEEIDVLKTRVEELERRLAELEGPVPPPSKLTLVPFTEPPLLLNRGSWDKYPDAPNGYHVLLDNGTLEVHVEQKAQPNERVIRRDFGFQDPHIEPGRGGFLREPEGVLRRYELSVTVPDPYDSRAEMCNLFQMHTESTKDPPIVSFFLWTKDVYIRHNGPQGTRVNYNLGAIKPGHTYNIAIEARWSDEDDGRLKVWVDGERIVNETGPNFKGGPPYLIAGPYAPSAIKEFSNTFIFSGLKVGDI